MFSALFSGWNISHISLSRLTFKWLNLELCVCALVCVFVDRKHVGVRVNAAEKREHWINTSLCLRVLQLQTRVRTKEQFQGGAKGTARGSGLFMAVFLPADKI